MLSKRISLPNLRDSSFVFPGKLTVISRHCLECGAEVELVDGCDVFIRMGIDIGCFASRASRMDSTIVSILEITMALLGNLVVLSVGSIDGWNMRDLGWLQRKNILGDEGMKKQSSSSAVLVTGWIMRRILVRKDKKNPKNWEFENFSPIPYLRCHMFRAFSLFSSRLKEGALFEHQVIITAPVLDATKSPHLSHRTRKTPTQSIFISATPKTLDFYANAASVAHLNSDF